MEEQDLARDLLHYGACITLSISEDSFLVSQGFVDEALNLHHFTGEFQTDFVSAVFRVLPSAMYAVQGELLGQAQKITTGTSHFGQDRLQILEENLEGELKTNIQNYANFKGQPLKFDSVVQFEHISSHKYITLHGQENAEHERDNLKVSLQDFGSEYSQFRIEACYSFQKEGDKNIHYGDKVKLAVMVPEMNKYAYIHCTVADQGYSPFARLRGFMNRSLEEVPRSVPLRQEDKEVNCSLDESTNWRINLFTPYMKEDSDYVLVGDHVWLAQTELRACLTAAAGTEEGFKIVFTNNMYDSNGLWKIEGVSYKAGGTVALGQGFRLRHISSGWYLSGSAVGKGFPGKEPGSAVLRRKPLGGSLTLISNPEPSTVWRFMPIHSRNSSKLLLRDEYFKIHHVVSRCYLNNTQLSEEVIPTLSSKESQSCIFKISRSDSSLVWEALFLINSLPVLQHFPQLMQGQVVQSSASEALAKNRDFKHHISLLKKCLRDLDLFCRNQLKSMMSLNHRYGQVESSRQNILREQQFLQALADILEIAFTGPYELKRSSKFLLEILEEHDELQQQRGLRLDTKTNLLSILVEADQQLKLLQQDIEKKQLKELADIVEQTYDLLTVICKDNQDNKQFVFKVFPIIQTHAPYIRHATVCMREIVKDNEALLIKLTQTEGLNYRLSIEGNPGERRETAIQYFAYLLRRFSEDRKWQLLEFLKTICTNQGQGISVNQEKVHEQLFNNPDTHAKTIITTMVGEDNQLLVFLRGPQGEHSIPLNSCFENSLPTAYFKELSYLKEMLDLFAAMCCSRNYICSDSISKWFPIKTLQVNMWNPQLSLPLRASFCNLMLALYIDAYPRSESLKPELCRLLQGQEPESRARRLEVAANHSLTSESGQEIRQTALNFTNALLKKKSGRRAADSGPTSLRSLVPGLVLQAGQKTENDLELPFSEENAILFELKEAILAYFSAKARDPEFNEFSLNLVKTAHKMCRFGLFDTFCTDFEARKCYLSAAHPNYDLRNMDIARLLRALESSLTLKATSLDAKRTSKAILGSEGKKKRNAATYNSLLAQVMKNPASLADPVVRGSVNLKNYIDSALHRSGSEEQTGNYELETKLEVCQLLHYAGNCRLDFLLRNVVEWVVRQEHSTVTEEEGVALLPPIMAVKHGNSEESWTFQCVLAPAFANLDDLLEAEGSLLGKLVTTFVFSQNYKLQTSLISLIIRLFSQRRELLAGLRDLHVLSEDRDITIYQWTRSNIVTLSHLAEQSEIWLKFWTQSDPKIRERDEIKLQKVTSILEHFDKMLTLQADVTQQNIADRQAMLYHLEVHTLLVSLIRDGMHALGELYETEAETTVLAAREKMVQLFGLCHSVLRRIVQGNSRIQGHFHDYLHIFMSHLNIDAQQVPLICDIYRDNAELCEGVKLSTLQHFIRLIVHHGRQPRFLDLFEVIQVVNSRPLPDNQRKVLNLFLDSDEQRRYLLFLKPEEDHEFCFEPLAPHEQALSPYLDVPFAYHIKLFQVLMKCGFGINKVYLNEAKCQKAIPLGAVFDLLEKAETAGNWMELRQPLLEFFFHIYLETEKLNEDLVGNAKFVHFLRRYETKLTRLDRITPQNLAEFSVFIKILYHYANSYAKSTDEAVMADQEDLVTLKSVASALAENIHKFQDCTVHRDTLTAAQKFFLAFEIGKDMYSVFTVEGVQEEEDRSRSELEKYGDRKTKWEQFRKDLLSSPKAKKAQKQELKSLVNALMNCQALNPALSFQLLAKTIITYLRNSVAESAPVPIVLDLISVFSYMVKADPDKLKERQEELNKFGATRVILALMSERSLAVEVYKALLHSAAKLLDGGNEQIQKEFYMFFINIPGSEVLFERLSKLLVTQADLLGSERMAQEKVETDQIRVSLRLLQLFCENHNSSLQNYIRQQTNSRNSYDLVSATVTLLAALMKRLMFRTFHVMSQCFDTLTEAIQGPCSANQDLLLKGMFLEIASSLMSYDEYQAIPTKYEALVSEGTACEDHGEPREYLTGWMLAHLKYKCLITVHSLMEGRKDSSIITRIIRAINLEILRENLVSFYVGYEGRYLADAYDRKMFGKTENNESYDLDAYSNPQDIHPEDYLVIIENAFAIYHLMRKFQDTDDPENKQIISEEMPELSVREEGSNFMAFRLIGDLGKIGLGLVKGGVKSLSKVASSVHAEHVHEHLDDLQKSAILEKTYEFLQRHTGNIEIVFNDQLCKVYFPLPYFSECLTDDMKEAFHSGVDRATDKTKLQGLMQRASELNEEMRHEYRLQAFIKTSWIMKLIADNLSTWKNLSFCLTLLLNFLILASFSSYGTDRVNESSLFYYESRGSGHGLSASGTNGLFITLGIIQSVVTTFIDVFFLVKVGPLLVSRGWRSVQSTQRKSRFARCYVCCKKTLKACLALFKEVDVVFYLFYLVFSLLGTFFNPLFFAFHLLDVLYRYPSLQNVIKSITIPREPLLLTFIFLLIIVYFFGIVGYVYLYNDFEAGQCETLFNCFCQVFDKGFKSDGGIGGYLQDWTPGKISVGRLFYDNAYNILIIIIMMNIVQGLTVDTFALLRRTHDKNKKDRENKCFICGLEKETIERATSRSFKWHIENDHNEWKYVHFVGYLEDKEETEYTGIESYVKDKVKKKDVSWFPQQEALSIQSQESDLEAVRLRESEEVKSAVLEIQQDVKELSKNLDAGLFAQQ